MFRLWIKAMACVELFWGWRWRGGEVITTEGMKGEILGRGGTWTDKNIEEKWILTDGTL
jgi:hypothetical protein